MADEIFTKPDDTSENWVDVRMTDPDEGEWDVDFVVVDGQVNYVDLRIQPGHLTGFVDCLLSDVDGERASRILSELVERRDIDLHTQTEDE